MAEPFRIYVGWDRREPEAYDVAEFSLKRRAWCAERDEMLRQRRT
jgi:hypothetical protein